MAFSADVSALPSPVWTTEPVTLKDFVMKYDVPTVGKIVKGQFMTIGAQKFPLQKLHQEVFIHSIKVGYKILAHSIRRVAVESRRGFTRGVATLEQRLSIPVSYQGWFQLLSEDGKAPRQIESVKELASLFPEKCLVRDNIRAFIVNTDGKLTLDKTKVVPAGEQLRLSGHISIPAPNSDKKIKLLRCTDSKGESVYLNFEQRGMFTPIAGAEDLAGILTIRDIVTRFRLPITVQLVQGVRPNVDASRFTGLVRLDWIYSEESAFVCPLGKSNLRILPVPTDVSLKLLSIENQDEVKKSETFQKIVAKCNKMVSNYNNTIHLIISVPESAMKTKIRSNTNLLTKKESTVEERRPTQRSSSREEVLMQEVDELYQYVKFGGQPPRNKFTYDSDEESYWEEPAYEPIDDFKARLALLDKGENVKYPNKYKPEDPENVKVNLHSPTKKPELNGVTRETHHITEKQPPPPLPPRRYARADSAPFLDVRETSKKNKYNRLSHAIGGKIQRSKSRDSRPSSSYKAEVASSSSDSGGKQKSGRGSTSEVSHTRKKLQTLYL